MLDARLLAPEAPRALKRVEYDQLVASGAFEDERVELIDGVLVTMSPNDPEHAGPVQFLTELLVRALSGRASVRVQLPIIARGESEPEPDLAVVPLASYRKEHPAAAHCVIEVARSSVSKDRNVKAPLYAASGFPEYWLVNVAERVIEVFRDPDQGAYRSVSRHGPGEVLRLQAFPDVAVQVADVLG
jgi:Uma2 family endonuclease